MLSAYVLIETEVGKVAHVAQALTKLDGVQLAEDLAGPYDLPSAAPLALITDSAGPVGTTALGCGQTRVSDLPLLGCGAHPKVRLKEGTGGPGPIRDCGPGRLLSDARLAAAAPRLGPPARPAGGTVTEPRKWQCKSCGWCWSAWAWLSAESWGSR
jgi:hypothetical protein